MKTPAFFVMSCLLVAASRGSVGDEIHQVLDAGPIDGDQWNVVSEPKGQGGDGPSKGGGKAGKSDREKRPIEIMLRPRIRGDFEITVSYEQGSTRPSPQGPPPGSHLRIDVDSPNGDIVTIERHVLLDGKHEFASDWIRPDATGELRHRVKRAPARLGSGQFRLARNGDTVQASFHEGDGRFRTLGEVNLGPDDVRQVRLTFGAERSPKKPGVVTKSVTVRANTLIPRGPRHLIAGMRPAAWSRVAIVLLIQFTIIVIFILGRDRFSVQRRSVH